MSQIVYVVPVLGLLALVYMFIKASWVGVKGQTNLEIAGSLRNIFRYGLRIEISGGRALLWLGGHGDLPNHCKLRIPMSTAWETDIGC